MSLMKAVSTLLP
eukprot:CCRYP_002146-RB/>CCRYP_002146-RB protein AED:0.49 eAED:0.49 QI:0/-1/0/1/-1/0/1/0/12